MFGAVWCKALPTNCQDGGCGRGGKAKIERAPNRKWMGVRAVDVGRWRSNDGTGAQQEMVGSRVLSSELVGIVEIEQDKAEIATKAKVE